jgi:hypothetical protein
MRRKALIGSAVTAAVLPLALMSPVHADVRRFHDSRTDESSYIGIRWVRVDNSTSERNKLKVVVRIGKIPPPPATGPRLDLFIDTDVQNPGPEYWLHSEQDYGLYHVHHGWSRHGQFIPTTCAGGTINHPSYISFVGDDPLGRGDQERLYRQAQPDSRGSSNLVEGPSTRLRLGEGLQKVSSVGGPLSFRFPSQRACPRAPKLAIGSRLSIRRTSSRVRGSSVMAWTVCNSFESSGSRCGDVAAPTYFARWARSPAKSGIAKRTAWSRGARYRPGASPRSHGNPFSGALSTGLPAR